MNRGMTHEDIKLRSTIQAIYKKCGEPDKPRPRKIPGKFGSCTYEEVRLSNQQMLDKIAKCELLKHK